MSVSMSLDVEPKEITGHPWAESLGIVRPSGRNG